MAGIDILDIDKKIRQEFEKKKEELPNLENKLNMIEKSLEKSNVLNVSINEKLNREKTIIMENMENLRYDLNLYIIDTEKILEEYVNILKIPQKVSFLGKSNVNIEKQTEIINKFITKAKKYITFLNFNIEGEKHEKGEKNEKNEKKKNREIDTCKNCQGKKFNIFENDMACISCGYIQEISWLDDCHSEVDRVSISCNYLYDRKNGFRDIIYRYQGKENCTIPDGLLKYLENECIKSGLIPPVSLDLQKSGDIKIPKKERFINVSRYNIIVFLDNSEYSSFKKHVFHIHWKLTGQPRNNISHLEEKIIQDFVIYVNTFFQEKGKIPGSLGGKKSLVKKQFLFYQLLMKYDHPCSIEDFFIIRSIDRVIEQENSCQETFQKLDWNYTSIY
jgi:hypothetical protein